MKFTIRVLGAAVVLFVAQHAYANCKLTEEVNKPGPKDAAFQSVRTEAFQGDAACQRLLSSMYGYGIGTPSSATAARRWSFISSFIGGRSAYDRLLPVFGTSGPQDIYDPVLAYALVYASHIEQKQEVLDFWAKKLLTSFDQEEAVRIGALLARHTK